MLIYYDSKKDMTPLLMGHDITKMLNAHDLSNRRIVILCIGSDRSTGDCLGPMIGHKLQGQLKHHANLTVFGTLQAPVHAINLVSTVNSIYDALEDPFIIAIDASLGKCDHIGFITLGTGGLRPGLGVKKELPEVGDIHITGIVNVSGNADTRILQTTRLSTIMTLADAITDGLMFTFNDMYSFQNITYQASYRRA